MLARMAGESPSGRFDGRTAAVTGAGGFIGGAVAGALAAEGAAVRAIDVSADLAERALELGVEPAVADVTDRAALDAALSDVELVVHAAAFVHEWGSMSEFERVNVRGTAAVLDAAAAAGAERVVHISSVVVYGYDDPSEQDETSFRRTCGIPYIDTKSASDRLASRRGAVVIRPGDVYGPGSIPWVARPLELAQSSLMVVPSGERWMLPVYVDDLVEAILLGLERGEPGRAYAVWGGERVTFHDYFSRIAQIAGTAPPRSGPRAALELAGAALDGWARLRGRAPALTARSATFIARRGTVSTERIRTELGWEPRVGLEEGLSRSAEWARSTGLVEN
jgi:nucleoside-diphosphate-sugar epimerase